MTTMISQKSAEINPNFSDRTSCPSYFGSFAGSGEGSVSSGLDRVRYPACPGCRGLSRRFFPDHDTTEPGKKAIPGFSFGSLASEPLRETGPRADMPLGLGPDRTAVPVPS